MLCSFKSTTTSKTHLMVDMHLRVLKLFRTVTHYELFIYSKGRSDCVASELEPESRCTSSVNIYTGSKFF